MSNQIISTEEARKILGETAKGMTDEQIDQLTGDLHVIARSTIQSILEGKTKLPSQKNID